MATDAAACRPPATLRTHPGSSARRKGTPFGSSCHANARRRARLSLGHGAGCIALVKQRWPTKVRGPASRPPCLATSLAKNDLSGSGASPSLTTIGSSPSLGLKSAVSPPNKRGPRSQLLKSVNPLVHARRTARRNSPSRCSGLRACAGKHRHGFDLRCRGRRPFSFAPLSTPSSYWSGEPRWLARAVGATRADRAQGRRSQARKCWP